MEDDGFNNSLEIDSDSDTNDDFKGDDITCSSCSESFSVSLRVYPGLRDYAKNVLLNIRRLFKHMRGLVIP